MERLTKLKGNYVCWNGNQDYSTRDRYAKVLDRLAAYEDTGLTPKQIEDIKKCLKRYDDDRIAAQQECGSVCEDAIEMHQQIKALTADKDEQAGRIMQLDSGLKKLRASLQWLKETIRDLDYKAWAEDNIGKIDALLGGKEDV